MTLAPRTFVIIVLLATNGLAGETDDIPRSMVTATRSGEIAMDRDSAGGNPFATALIKAMDEKPKTMSGLRGLLSKITKKQSGGHHSPDFPRFAVNGPVPFSSESKKASRIAMILVYSDYSDSDMPTLLGAKFDFKRLREAFTKNGFDCWVLLDPTMDQVTTKLTAFRKRSNQYEFSIMYVTGHGAEVDGQIHLFPSSFNISDGVKALRKKSLNINDLQNHLNARKGNILFYGGCRDNPFD